MSWKHILTYAGAALVTMYAIRYLKASNSSIGQTVATIWPTQLAAAQPTQPSA